MAWTPSPWTGTRCRSKAMLFGGQVSSRGTLPGLPAPQGAAARGPVDSKTLRASSASRSRRSCVPHRRGKKSLARVAVRRKPTRSGPSCLRSSKRRCKERVSRAFSLRRKLPTTSWMSYTAPSTALALAADLRPPRRRRGLAA